MKPRTLVGLLVLLYLLVLGDTLSTYLCLGTFSNPAVIEANPFPRWIFETMGLGLGSTALAFSKSVLLYFLYLIHEHRPKSRRVITIGVWVTLAAMTITNLNNWYIVYRLLT